MSDSTEQSTVPSSEISELLDAMMMELRFRGCETEHKLIRRALAMQKRLQQQD